jgi:hypothetical protein
MTITDYKIVRDTLAVHSITDENGDETDLVRVVMSVAACDDTDPLVDIVSVSVEWDYTNEPTDLRALIIADVTDRLTAPNNGIVDQILNAL